MPDDQLFTIPESLSPRARWMKQHQVSVSHYPQFNGQDEDEFGNILYPYQAYVEDDNHEAIGGDNATAGAMSYDDALVALAEKQGWQDWRQS